MMKRLTGVWALLGGILVLLIVFATAINVSAFTLDSILKPFGIFVPALSGYEDFVRLAVSVAALSFFPYCQIRRGHISVDLFVRNFPEGLQRFLDRLWLLLTAVVALFLAYWMVLGLLETRADNTMTSVLGWLEWPWYVPGIVSMVLWSLTCLVQFFGGRSLG